MGKGDRRSRRGKLFRGTFGKTRKHKTDSKITKAAPPPAEESKPQAPKKKAARKKAEQ